MVILKWLFSWPSDSTFSKCQGSREPCWSQLSQKDCVTPSLSLDNISSILGHQAVVCNAGQLGLQFALEWIISFQVCDLFSTAHIYYFRSFTAFFQLQELRIYLCWKIKVWLQKKLMEAQRGFWVGLILMEKGEPVKTNPRTFCLTSCGFTAGRPRLLVFWWYWKAAMFPVWVMRQSQMNSSNPQQLMLCSYLRTQTKTNWEANPGSPQNYSVLQNRKV